MSTRFFVELARDPEGNTGHGRVVIEAEAPTETSLRVVGPPEFRAKWPTLTNYREWLEVEGPARQLTISEWEALTDQKRL